MWVIIRRVLIGLATLAVLAVSVLYIWSSVLLNQTFTAENRSISLSTDPEVLAEGERKAQIFGCYHGCHGRDMQGDTFFDEPFIARLFAPNLTQASRKFTASEMEAMIRQGIRPDGTGLIAMPSNSFAIMTDEDLIAILSFIHEFPEQPSEPQTNSFGLLARALIISGEVPVGNGSDAATPWNSSLLDTPLKLGEYLAMNACSECHGLQYEGNADFAPPLAIAKAYNREQFHALLKEGEALVPRDLGLMGLVAKFRFSHLNSDEIDAIYDFLQAR